MPSESFIDPSRGSQSPRGKHNQHIVQPSSAIADEKVICSHKAGEDNSMPFARERS